MSSPVADLLSSHPRGSAAGRLARQVLRGIAAVARAVVHRRDVMHLLELDARQLKDIGLARNDVLGALAGPLSSDPSVLLRLRSVENRARVREVMRAADAQDRRAKTKAADRRERSDAAV